MDHFFRNPKTWLDSAIKVTQVGVSKNPRKNVFYCEKPLSQIWIPRESKVWIPRESKIWIPAFLGMGIKVTRPFLYHSS